MKKNCRTEGCSGPIYYHPIGELRERAFCCSIDAAQEEIPSTCVLQPSDIPLDKRPFGISPGELEQLESGDIETLLSHLVSFSRRWLEISGVPVQAWGGMCFSDVAASDLTREPQKTPEQRAFLAAGCDLLNLLSLTPKGREAIRHLVG